MVAMPKLIDPDPALPPSFRDAVAEFRADRDFPVPWFVEDVDPGALTSPAAFRAHVTRLLGERTEEAGAARNVPDGMGPGPGGGTGGLTP